jgi:hypothetical protein
LHNRLRITVQGDKTKSLALYRAGRIFEDEKVLLFSLNLNDPKKPKLFCIGNDPTWKIPFPRLSAE